MVPLYYIMKRLLSEGDVLRFALVSHVQLFCSLLLSLWLSMLSLNSQFERLKFRDQADIVFASPNLRSRFHQFVIAGNCELTGGSNVNDTSFDNEIEK